MAAIFSIRPSSIQNQSGSVLVIILVAIALFAALSYAVMRDGGTGTATRTMSDAQARLAAMELMNILRTRAEAYQRLRIRGCSENNIHLGTGRGVPTPPSLLADESCHIESVQGAGLSQANIPKHFQKPPSPAYDYQISTLILWSPRVMILDPEQASYVSGLGKEDGPDYMTQFNFVLPEICVTYNKMIGIEGIPRDRGNIIGDESPALHGERTACRETNLGSSGDTHTQIYYVHHVN